MNTAEHLVVLATAFTSDAIRHAGKLTDEELSEVAREAAAVVAVCLTEIKIRTAALELELRQTAMPKR